MQDKEFIVTWPLRSPSSANGCGGLTIFPVDDGIPCSVALAFFTDADLLERFVEENPHIKGCYELADHAQLRNWLDEVLRNYPQIRWYVFDPAPPNLNIRKIDTLREWAARFAN